MLLPMLLIKCFLSLLRAQVLPWALLAQCLMLALIFVLAQLLVLAQTCLLVLSQLWRLEYTFRGPWLDSCLINPYIALPEVLDLILLINPDCLYVFQIFYSVVRQELLMRFLLTNKITWCSVLCLLALIPLMNMLKHVKVFRRLCCLSALWLHTLRKSFLTRWSD
jgi:hypothetical protein